MDPVAIGALALAGVDTLVSVGMFLYSRRDPFEERLRKLELGAQGCVNRTEFYKELGQARAQLAAWQDQLSQSVRSLEESARIRSAIAADRARRRHHDET